MSGEVIVTVTLNAALHVTYRVGRAEPGEHMTPVSRPRYLAGGRGVTVARLLHEFGHDVLAAGLAGGATGELIVQDLARSAVPAEFTQIRGESRRIFAFGDGDGDGDRDRDRDAVRRFAEPGPYITTEELGRFAADYRRMLASAAAVVLCGSLPDGLPPDMYASLVRYAAEAGVPAVLDGGGEEMVLATRKCPDLVVAEARDADAAQDLLRSGAVAAAVIVDGTVSVVTKSERWTARVSPSSAPSAGPATPFAVLDRGALVAGLVPGELLGWSWPDRLRHSVALAATVARSGGEPGLSGYETLLDTVTITSQ
ncbi:MAG TPA: PfkB family carbohydrate kinase [Streptosporangiaceae bacterium]|nr:PfkB family carbohydrate kinase [Streptosporangiaceae bacterium]